MKRKNFLSLLIGGTMFFLPVLTFITSCGSSSEKAHEHSFVMHTATPEFIVEQATCTAPAKYYVSCSCGEKGTTTFESGSPASHSYTDKNTDSKYLVTPASCTSKAKYYYSCVNCHAVGSETFESGDLEEHKFDKKDTNKKFLVKEATCTTPATYYYSCSKCGAKGTETFESGSPKDHVYDGKVESNEYLASEGTCIERKEYFYSCSACGKKGERTFVSSKYGEHDFSGKSTTRDHLKTPADCNNAAVYYYSCIHCGENSSETFVSGEPNEHSFYEKVTTQEFLASPADCQNQARYYYSCSHCGAKGTSTFASGPYGEHVYDKKVMSNNTLAQKATCVTPAKYYYSCKCGALGTKTFDSEEYAAHSFTAKIQTEDYLAQEPTCSSPAKYYFACSVCGEKGTNTYTTNEYLEHSLVVDYLPSSTSTYFTAHCEVCGKTTNVPFKLNTKEYTVISSIYLDGTQVFDTGISVDSKVFKISAEAFPDGSSLSGTSNLTLLSYPGLMDVSYNRGDYLNSPSFNENDRYLWINLDDLYKAKNILKLGQSDNERFFTVDGKTQFDSKEINVLTGSTLLIGGNYDKNTSSYKDFYKGQISRVQISVNGVLLGYYIPVVNSKGDVGLYNVINDTFYKNINTEGNNCGYGSETALTHTHIFNVKNTDKNHLCKEATCTSKARYYVSCSCGAIGLNTYEAGEYKNHNYDVSISSYPTNEQDGKAYCICNDCGYETEITLPKIDTTNYQVIDYIESNGTQTIDTGLVFKDGSSSGELYIDLQILSDFNYGWFGAQWYLENSTYGMNTVDRVDNITKYNPYDFNKTRYNNGIPYRSEDIQEELVNLGQHQTNFYEVFTNIKITLFTLGAPNNSFYPSDGYSFAAERIYKSHIILDGKLERVFIPVVNITTGEAGLYDVITQLFYGNCNKDGDAFIVGHTDNIKDFEQLEYLEMDGNSIVDTSVYFPAVWVHDIEPIESNQYSYYGGYTSTNMYDWGVQSNGKIFAGEDRKETEISLNERTTITLAADPVSNQTYLDINNQKVELNNKYNQGMLFGQYRIGGKYEENYHNGSFKLYSVKAYYNGKEVRSYIPVKRVSDNILGLFDTVESKFYPLKETPINPLDVAICGDSHVYSPEIAYYSSLLLADGYSFESIYKLRNAKPYSEEWLYELVDYMCYKETPEESLIDSQQYNLLKKTITINNQDYNSYILVLAGTGETSEWGSNLKVGDPNRTFHEGFEKGADYVLNRIMGFFEKDPEHNRLLIAGHSRGGAVGGILADKLLQKTEYFNPEYIKTYLMAVPHYSYRTNVTKDNIFIINNPGDMVTIIPPTVWGFYTEGTVHNFSVDPSTISKVSSKMYKITTRYYTDESETKPIEVYKGLLSTEEKLNLFESLASNPQIIRDERNAELLAQVGNLLSSNEQNLDVYKDILTEFATRCIIDKGYITISSVISFLGDYGISFFDINLENPDPEMFAPLVDSIVGDVDGIFQAHIIETYVAFLEVELEEANA